MKILDVPQSGSIAGVTSSRNRYGQYRRTRAIPVNPDTAAQSVVRSRFATNTGAWRNLTANQRAGWETLADELTRTDSLGQSINLSGFQAYMSVNGNNLAAGNAVVADAPGVLTPPDLTSITPTLTNAAFSLAYTATPLAAGVRAFVYAGPQRSAGRSFEGDLRLIQVSAAAAASPANILAAYSARFGAPVVGNRIFYSIKLYQGGFLGTALGGSAIVA